MTVAVVVLTLTSFSVTVVVTTTTTVSRPSLCTLAAAPPAFVAAGDGAAVRNVVSWVVIFTVVVGSTVASATLGLIEVSIGAKLMELKDLVLKAASVLAGGGAVDGWGVVVGWGASVEAEEWKWWVLERRVVTVLVGGSWPTVFVTSDAGSLVVVGAPKVAVLLEDESTVEVGLAVTVSVWTERGRVTVSVAVYESVSVGSEKPVLVVVPVVAAVVDGTAGTEPNTFSTVAGSKQSI